MRAKPVTPARSAAKLASSRNRLSGGPVVLLERECGKRLGEEPEDGPGSPFSACPNAVMARRAPGFATWCASRSASTRSSALRGPLTLKRLPHHLTESRPAPSARVLAPAFAQDQR